MRAYIGALKVAYVNENVVYSTANVKLLSVIKSDLSIICYLRDLMVIVVVKPAELVLHI